MGYNARNDEIRDNVLRMQREWEAQRAALATVRRFNARLSAKGEGMGLQNSNEFARGHCAERVKQFLPPGSVNRRE